MSCVDDLISVLPGSCLSLADIVNQSKTSDFWTEFSGRVRPSRTAFEQGLARRKRSVVLEIPLVTAATWVRTDDGRSGLCYAVLSNRGKKSVASAGVVCDTAQGRVAYIGSATNSGHLRIATRSEAWRVKRSKRGERSSQGLEDPRLKPKSSPLQVSDPEAFLLSPLLAPEPKQQVQSRRIYLACVVFLLSAATGGELEASTSLASVTFCDSLPDHPSIKVSNCSSHVSSSITTARSPSYVLMVLLLL